MPENVGPAMREVVQYVAIKEGTALHYQPKLITVQVAQTGWRGYKERILSTGRINKNTRFGHWKTGFQDNALVDFHPDMANVPYLLGCSPLVFLSKLV